MKKKISLSNIHLLKRLPDIGLQTGDNIYLIDLEELKEHEEIHPEYLEQLRNEILSDGILKMPIAVDKTTHIILDGHHRLHALKRIGCKRIPVILFDYHSPEIAIVPHRDGETVTKEMVIQTALAGRRMPPKTSRHMIMIEGELKHISIVETVPANDLVKDLEGEIKNICVVGDCYSPRKMIDAVYEGFLAATNI